MENPYSAYRKAYCLECDKPCETDISYRDKYTNIERMQKCIEARTILKKMDIMHIKNGQDVAKELRVNK